MTVGIRSPFPKGPIEVRNCDNGSHTLLLKFESGASLTLEFQAPDNDTSANHVKVTVYGLQAAVNTP